MNCELCEAKKLAPWYYSDSLIWIADCETCSKNGNHIPMGVLNRHTMHPTQEEYQQLVTKLHEIGTKVFGKNNFYFDHKQKKIKDHLHIHARKNKGKGK